MASDEKANMGIEKLDNISLKRARSIVLGRSGMSVKQMVGFMKEAEPEPVADTTAITRMTAIPLFCGTCKRPMKSRYDTEVYKIHRMCSRCHAEHETVSKIDGTWLNDIDTRRKEIMLDEVLQQIQQVEEYANRNGEIVNSIGQSEHWTDDNKFFIQKLLDNLYTVRDELRESTSPDGSS